jgi:regulator of sigma E protease
MMDVLISVVSVVIVLGIMILVHEWGHFIAAKSFGVRVEIFSIGFGPRLWGRKRGDTDYRISALPLGGYVKMAGDTPGEERSGADDEFQSKPRWQRVVIALAGPTMNLLMAVVLVTVTFAVVGIPYPAYFERPVEVVGLQSGSPAAQAGLQPGDHVTSLNGIESPTWEQAQEHLSKQQPGAELTLTVERQGKTVEVVVEVSEPRDLMGTLGYPPMPAVVDQVAPGRPAAKAGLKPGDEVVEFDGKPVLTWPQFAQAIRTSGGNTMQIVVRRGKENVKLEVTPAPVQTASGGTIWQIGMLNRPELIFRKLGLVPAVEQGVLWNVAVTRQILVVVGQLFTGKASLGEMQGVVGIAQESGRAARRGPLDVINLMALISLNLGILNLLPIPILDGGHILVLTIEGLLRRDLSLNLKERIVQVGFVFLLAVFAYVMYNDIGRIVTSR